MQLPKYWKSYLEGSIGGAIPPQFKLAVITDATCGSKYNTNVCNPVPSPIEDATPVRIQKHMNHVSFQTGGNMMKVSKSDTIPPRMNLFLSILVDCFKRSIVRCKRILSVIKGWVKRDIFLV